MKRDNDDLGYDANTEHEILSRHDANVRHHDVMTTLRRELRDLCRQAILGNYGAKGVRQTELSNLEAFAVLAQIAPRGMMAVANPDLLASSQHALEAFQSSNSECIRLVSLAADAFQAAARAIADDPAPLRKAS